MPDPRPRLAFSGLRAEGRWLQRPVAGAVTLFVEELELVVRLDANGEELAIPLAALGGASWRAGVLTLHLADEELQLGEGEGLDRAWHALTLRTCTLPEVARGLRALGTLAGRWADAHARFFAPLLQARRRLEGDEPMDWKVAGFDAAVLAERVRAALAAIALERYPDRPPHRRALEAGLLDASDPFLRQLERVADAAREVHEIDDALRFVAWRSWAGELRLLFIQADRSWRAIAHVLAEEGVADAPSRP
jgi:hypothetical protein